MTESHDTRQTPRLQFSLNWKLLLFSLLFLPLLTGLGFWQLQRAEEKRTIQESWQIQQAQPAVDWQSIPATGEPGASGAQEESYRRVSVEGRFLSDYYWLLENRILDGKLGYEVVMPFLPDDGPADQVVMVNRGWQPAGAYRSDLPEVATPNGKLRITGSLVKPSDNRLVEHHGQRPTAWPEKVLEVDLGAMQRQLQAEGVSAEVFPRLIQIDAESPGAFHTNWQPINMSPATHRGYAVQWFGLAAALLILTLIANTNIFEVLFRRKRARDSNSD